MHPVLTLLLATSVGWSAPEAKDQVAQLLAVAATQMVDALPSTRVDSEAAALTVRDVRFYYDAFLPAAVPDAPVLIAYDWRLPYHLTKP